MLERLHEAEIRQQIASLNKAIQGLPNLVKACDDMLSGDEAGGEPGPQRALVKCVANLTKTQIGFAKILRFQLERELNRSAVVVLPEQDPEGEAP